MFTHPTGRVHLKFTLVSALLVGALGALALGLTMSPTAAYAALVSGLVLLSIGDGAVGLALLVLVANADGLSTAVLVVSAGIAAIALVALNLRPAPVDPAAPPCPRALARSH